MIKVLKNLLFSVRSALILMALFAFMIAVATFLENDYGTRTAKALVYGSVWFESLMLLLATNLVYNIFRFRLFRREKWPTGLFHFSFIVILLGAAVTRYYGYEGTMHIREGEIQDLTISYDPFLQINVTEADKRYHFEEPMLLSALGANSFTREYSLDNGVLRVSLIEYIPRAKEVLVPSRNGSEFIELAISFGQKSEELLLERGEKGTFGKIKIGFESGDADIEIKKRGAKPLLVSKREVTAFGMKDGSLYRYPPGTEIELKKGYVYDSFGIKTVFKNLKEGYTKKYVLAAARDEGQNEALVLDFEYGGVKKRIVLLGRPSLLPKFLNLSLKDLNISVGYGSKKVPLPFALKLTDFEMEKYPGSMSPSSYASEVVVIDRKKGIEMPYRIYMNHVLDYEGYRFFQSSYDLDEKGTVLSVNRDPGALITYIGYALLFFAMVAHLFMPQSRFMKLFRLTKRVQKKREILTGAAVFGFLMLGFASGLRADTSLLDKARVFESEHALKFGTLLVQDRDGRIEPLDTLARMVLAKVTRTDRFEGMQAVSVFLGMTVKPDLWQKIEMIYVSDPKIASMLGAEGKRYLSFATFFDENGYRLEKKLLEATRKKPSQRSGFENELIKVDERVNICYMVYTGRLLRIFPKPGDKNLTWYSPVEAIKSFPPVQSELVRLISASYFANIEEALKSGDWSKADEALGVIKDYQRYYGASLIPPQTKIEAELLYNRLDIFNRLVPFYSIVGSVLLVLILISLIYPRFDLSPVIKIGTLFVLLGFLAHTFALGLRWYVAGHAPWSNGYESMIYIAWAIVLAGLLFSRNSPIAFAASSLLGGLILFVAHLNWLDPQITTLVPVLKSYWLMIHVSVITASYGFFALSALLAATVLILHLFVGENNKKVMILSIKELTYTNEMSLIIGLVLVTIGNFLGGVWANESWGRYWGWDPKETWALVTILVYAIVAHMRLVPGLNSLFVFNVASLLAFFSVLMTYFGVNFYLSGLHSYAQGDPLPIPAWIYSLLVTLAILIGLAYYKKRKERLELRLN